MNFIPGFPPRIVSFSDDKTCKIWDVSNENEIMNLNGHTDFIRAGTVNASSPHMVISGSDDRTVRLWDTRTGKTVTTLDHGSGHVNDILCYPTGTVLATAAGCEIRIWDLTAGKLLSKICRHHKDVTSLCLASKGSRLVSGSLDRHLKFYDTNTYNVVHTVDCPAAVLSFAITSEDTGLFVGMIAESKGLLSLQRRKGNDAPSIKGKKYELPTQSTTVKVIMEEHWQQLSKIDSRLRNSSYTECLQSMLERTNASETVALFAELIRIGGFQAAVAGNDEVLLKRLFNFLDKYLRHPSYQSVLLNVVSICLDVYADKATEETFISKRLGRIYEQLRSDIAHTKEMLNMEQDINMIETVPRQTSAKSNLFIPQMINN